MLTTDTLPALQRALTAAGLDGWLLFDFHGANPIAGGMLRLEGMVSRRIFAWVPASGPPVAITHAIEQGPWHAWPPEWHREIYSSWRTLESLVAGLVRGKRVAMEYSPGDAVPYLDRVPGGVLEMVRAAGATVVTSADLVTAFYATWTEPQLETHRRAAEAIATIACQAIARAGALASAGTSVTEYELQQWIGERFTAAGLLTSHPPIVGAASNAANPHYEPSATDSRRIQRGDILLVDLWAYEPGGVYADQTWMGSLGTPTPEATAVWLAVRDARDAAIALLRERISSGQQVRGAEVDDAARNVIVARGFGKFFTHRTGHSIDSRDLHGAGPHIDNLETREERLLAPGVAFSIEPGVYMPGGIGMRSEVNGYVGRDGVVITPDEYQRELLLV